MSAAAGTPRASRIKPRRPVPKPYTPDGPAPNFRVLLAAEREAHQRTWDALGRFAAKLAVLMDEQRVEIGLPEVGE